MLDSSPTTAMTGFLDDFGAALAAGDIARATAMFHTD